MIALYVNYMSGDFYVGDFETEEKAKAYYEKRKERFVDYRGAKFGFPFGTPIYVNKEN